MGSYKNGDIPVQNIWGCENPMRKETGLPWNATGLYHSWQSQNINGTICTEHN